jgi:hemoglobin
MQYTITQALPGARPQVQPPNPLLLEYLGEAGIRKMVSDHYEIIRVSSIKDLFPQTDADLEMAKKHAADFLIQLCGGPRYFDESRGAPRMVARHAPFKITQEARRIWLEAYIIVLKDLDLDEDVKQSLWNYLDIFSIWMINTPA